ncbi:MAG: hypothetical protein ACPGID_01810 [Rubricella sp.]
MRKTLSLLGIILAGPAAADTSAMIFGGVLTDNDWVQIPGIVDVELERPGLVGVALSHDLWEGERWSFGVEGQVVGHAGLQSNWEFNGLAYIRRDFEPGWLSSAAFGIGWSEADRRPVYEVARSGESDRGKIYWTIELGFPAARDDSEYTLRIHHRSSGYGLAGEEGGSNAIVLGYRRSF